MVVDENTGRKCIELKCLFAGLQEIWNAKKIFSIPIFR